MQELFRLLEEGLKDARSRRQKHRFKAVGTLAARLALTLVKNKNSSSGYVKLVKEAFRLIYRSKYNTRQAIEAMQKELTPTQEVTEIIRFIEQSERGIIH